MAKVALFQNGVDETTEHLYCLDKEMNALSLYTLSNHVDLSAIKSRCWITDRITMLVIGLAEGPIIITPLNGASTRLNPKQNQGHGKLIV